MRAAFPVLLNSNAHVPFHISTQKQASENQLNRIAPFLKIGKTFSTKQYEGI